MFSFRGLKMQLVTPPPQPALAISKRNGPLST